MNKEEQTKWRSDVVDSILNRDGGQFDRDETAADYVDGSDYANGDYWQYDEVEADFAAAREFG